jgi:hypothetical protein
MPPNACATRKLQGNMDKPEGKPERNALPDELLSVLWPALQVGGISGRHLQITCILSSLERREFHVITDETMASHVWSSNWAPWLILFAGRYVRSTVWRRCRNFEVVKPNTFCHCFWHTMVHIRKHILGYV